MLQYQRLMHDPLGDRRLSGALTWMPRLLLWYTARQWPSSSSNEMQSVVKASSWSSS